jgi:thiol-disulfide isomerase/thioredoxin
MHRRILCLFFAVTLLGGAVVAQTQKPSPEEELKAAVAGQDGAERRGALRAFIAKHPEGYLESTAHLLLVRSLVKAKTPADEILAAARAALDAIPANNSDMLEYRVEVAVSAASALGDRKEAVGLVRTVIDALPSGKRAREARGALEVILAGIQSKQGDRDAAVATLEAAVAADPDNQAALGALAIELQAAGRVDEAIDAYARAETVFGGRQVDGKPLRELYAQRYKSLAGLDDRLKRAARESTRRVALEARRADGPAPEWELADLAGAKVKLTALRGQVVVLDFWATWCPPCRDEMPILEEMHRQFATSPVKILALNCEGIEDRKAWDAAVRNFVREIKATLPVLSDYDGTVQDAYNVTALPTIVVIDREGAVRYRNVGFDPRIKKVLRAQIESLLD